MNVRVFDSSGNVALLCGGLLVLVRFFATRIMMH